MLRIGFNRGIVNTLNLSKINKRWQSNGFQKKPLFNVGMAASGALVLGLAGAFTYQYRSNLKLEEEISSQKNAVSSKMRELRTLQLQLEEIKKAQEKSDVIGDSTTGQETDNKDEQKSQTKTEEKTEQIDDINTKIDNDFRVSLEKKYQKMLKKYRENLEEELRHHLKRQLAAHNDHLQEQLQLLARELERKNQVVLEESLLSERLHYQSQLSDSINRLQTIESILKIRDQLDNDERVAKELWLACQLLKDVLKYSTSNLESEPLPKLLTNQLKVIRDTLKEYSNISLLANAALDSISNDAINHGIYSEDDLINRFTKIEKICRKVALIGDEGGTLFKYLLSYVQSFLIFNQSKITNEELTDQEIDPSKWDTFDILGRVTYCLKRNNLEMALRYANQLKGEPRKVAKDWIKDTRNHLEIKQVVDILVNQAASISAQVLQ